MIHLLQQQTDRIRDMATFFSVWGIVYNHWVVEERRLNQRYGSALFMRNILCKALACRPNTVLPALRHHLFIAKMDLLWSGTHQNTQQDHVLMWKILHSLWWNAGIKHGDDASQNFVECVQDVLSEEEWTRSGTHRRRERFLRHLKKDFPCIGLDGVVFALYESDDPAALLRVEALL